MKRLEDFYTYANEDGIFYRKQLEDAADAWCQDIGGCDSLFGPRGEFATIITAFGRKDKRQYYLTKDDIKALFYDNNWPEGFDQRRTPETGGATMIDITMFTRFMKMKDEEKVNAKRLGHGITIPPSEQKEEFRPWPNPPVSDNPNGTVISQEDIYTKVNGGRLCVFDSRYGGIQPVINGTRWKFTPDMYQTTIAEVLGEEPPSSGPPYLLIILVAALAYFVGRRTGFGASSSSSVAISMDDDFSGIPVTKEKLVESAPQETSSESTPLKTSSKTSSTKRATKLQTPKRKRRQGIFGR